MNTHCNLLNFKKPPWDDIVLVTPHKRNVMHLLCTSTAKRLVNFYIYVRPRIQLEKNDRNLFLEEMTIATGLNPEEDL